MTKCGEKNTHIDRHNTWKLLVKCIISFELWISYLFWFMATPLIRCRGNFVISGCAFSAGERVFAQRHPTEKLYWNSSIYGIKSDKTFFTPLQPVERDKLQFHAFILIRCFDKFMSKLLSSRLRGIPIGHHGHDTVDWLLAAATVSTHINYYYRPREWRKWNAIIKHLLEG